MKPVIALFCFIFSVAGSDGRLEQLKDQANFAATRFEYQTLMAEAAINHLYALETMGKVKILLWPPAAKARKAELNAGWTNLLQISLDRHESAMEAMKAVLEIWDMPGQPTPEFLTWARGIESRVDAKLPADLQTKARKCISKLKAKQDRELFASDFLK